MVKVTIKWNKKKFKGVEIDTSKGKIGKDFKIQLQKLTGVPADRQKVIGLGKASSILKDDSELSEITIKPNQIVNLLGTAEALPEPPKEKVVFAEDISSNDQSLVMESYPSGLTNLGNTCYMNASIQCLKQIPELKKGLQDILKSNTEQNDKFFPLFYQLFNELEGKSEAVTPVQFLTELRKKYPQFDEKTSSPLGDVYSQQDADELVGNLLSNVQQKMKNAKSKYSSLFQGEFETIEKCTENEEEEPKKKVDVFYKLPVFINQQVSNLNMGLEQSLTVSKEKQSPSLQRSAIYTETSRIKKLPPYLFINYVRFYWKQSAQVKAKVLRNVKFPLVLDVFDYCTDSLKETLKVKREKLRKEKEDNLMKKYKGDNEDDKGKKTLNEGSDSTTKETVSNEKDSDKMDVEEPDELENTTAYYDLIGVITHKGRTANSGHYVGWTKDEKNNRWLKYDDDIVSTTDEETIKKLSGGGDFDTCYLLLYKKRDTAP